MAVESLDFNDSIAVLVGRIKATPYTRATLKLFHPGA
jgi:hypothetical protein